MAEIKHLISRTGPDLVSLAPVVQKLEDARHGTSKIFSDAFRINLQKKIG